jgi:pilus assembly protein CpaB
MNRRNRHIVVLAVAIVTASLASLGVYKVTAGLPTAAASSQVDVVVAARALAIGTLLTEKDVKVVRWPANSPVQGAISKVTEVVNRAVLTNVLQNDVITTNKLANSEAGGGLPPAIPQGMRAMSVKVNDVIGVAGFIVPGSRVDVVVTMRQGQDSVTSTVASNVQVLAAGTRRDQEQPATPAPTSAAAKANESTVVTLMVSPKDAERIALAQTDGQIMLALRNPLDQQPTLTDGVRTRALLGEPAPAPAPPPAPKPAPRRVVSAPKEPEVAPPAPPRTVEAIRAAKRSEEVIKEVIK